MRFGFFTCRVRLPRAADHLHPRKVRTGLLLIPMTLSSCGAGDDPAPNDDADPPELPNDDGGDGDGDEYDDPTEAPEFGGVQAAVVENRVDVHIRWSPARDNDTDANQLVYAVYVGETRGGIALPVSIKTPFAVTAPGQTSYWLRDLPAGQYRFVVRAVDRFGNEDQNTASTSVTVRDTKSPTFDGVLGAVAETSREVRVEWNAASDNVTVPERMRYELFFGTSRKDLFDEKPLHPLPGATSHLIALDNELLEDIEKEGVTVWVGVRAQDEAGNREWNERRTSVKTPENVPPSFEGLDRVAPHPDGVELSWHRGEDNEGGTPTAELVYLVYASEESGAQNFLKPYAITSPGVSRFVLTDLKPETQYYFVVQARDQSGNRDGNHVERGFVTREEDTTPPTFGGLTEARSYTPTSVDLAWDPATDNRSASSEISYEVYLSTEAGGHDFKVSPWAVSPKGRTSMVVLGLEPDTEYYAVVRARDAAGQRAKNKKELSFATKARDGDERAPQLTGNLLVSLVPDRPDSLQIGWSGAEDDQGDIRGHVCVGTEAARCERDTAFAQPNASSKMGFSSVLIDGLNSRSEYWVGILLEDENGNFTRTPVLRRGATATSYTDDVFPILDTRCNQCHDFRYGTVLNVPSDYEALPLVRPDLPTDSYLFRTLRPQGDESAPFSEEQPADYAIKRMPSDGTAYLDEETQKVLADWISQGAFEN